jgi:biopolymer transport protein ExbB
METTVFFLMDLFKMGGIFMWPLLLFSITAAAIVFERIAYLLYHNLRMDDMEETLGIFIRDGDLAGAEGYLSGLARRRMGARVLLIMVKRSGLGEHLMEKAVEAEARSCVNSLENGFTILSALGSLAPLTGFLGTVSGMIGAFKSIAEAAELNARIVANGIYEALITTVFGLVIAIAAMAFHSIISHLVDKFAAELEKSCSGLCTEFAAIRASSSCICPVPEPGRETGEP